MKKIFIVLMILVLVGICIALFKWVVSNRVILEYQVNPQETLRVEIPIDALEPV